LGGGHTREVSSASATLEIIQYFISFLDDEETTEYGIYHPMINNTSNEEVLRGWMVDTSTIIMREMRTKFLCVKVHKDVFVPWVCWITERGAGVNR
jgi:hypothetical protein